MLILTNTTQRLRSNGDFYLDTRLERDRCLEPKLARDQKQKANTHDLLDNLAGRVEVNQTLVNLEFITIPCLGTFTARLLVERDN
jgi:hypothetical protein